MHGRDPLHELRHALAGVAVALLLSVAAAACAGSLLGDLFGGGYALRAGLYAALLLYVLAGAAVVLVKVARHETQRLTPWRAGLWFASLWMWPALLFRRRAG